MGLFRPSGQAFSLKHYTLFRLSGHASPSPIATSGHSLSPPDLLLSDSPTLRLQLVSLYGIAYFCPTEYNQ
ncbi:MAG: hypothetical protein IPO63_10420 [Bacteroidetes bacterium]|nr:hypothetical protein [Bacteroidota bacterium]